MTAGPPACRCDLTDAGPSPGASLLVGDEMNGNLDSVHRAFMVILLGCSRGARTERAASNTAWSRDAEIVGLDAFAGKRVRAPGCRHVLEQRSSASSVCYPARARAVKRSPSTSVCAWR